METLNLFNINKYIIDMEDFSHLLHDSIEDVLAQKFADYVGAKHAAVANSASSLMFLSLRNIIESPHKVSLQNKPIFLPSMIPPAVANVVHNSGFPAIWKDDVDWVGHSYTLYDTKGIEPDLQPSNMHADKSSPRQSPVARRGLKIIDSAQEVRRNMFQEDASPQDLMIFSLYPTKPVGGIDGGIIVSNNLEAINFFKVSVNLGSTIISQNPEQQREDSGQGDVLDEIGNNFEWSGENSPENRGQLIDQARKKVESQAESIEVD